MIHEHTKIVRRRIQDINDPTELRIPRSIMANSKEARITVERSWTVSGQAFTACDVQYSIQIQDQYYKDSSRRFAALWTSFHVLVCPNEFGSHRLNSTDETCIYV